MQVQVKAPVVFSQLALASQLSASVAHSSMSVQAVPSPE